METEYHYPSDLESDDVSDQYDWSDADADADSLADNVSFMSLHSTPRSPPPRYSSTTSLPAYTTGPTCVVCKKKPPYCNPNTGQSYPTCGLTCASKLSQQGTNTPFKGTTSSSSTPGRRGTYYRRGTSRRPSGQLKGLDDLVLHGFPATRSAAAPIQPNRPVCVVCKARSTHRDYVTCGLKCAEKLCKDGGDPKMCNYCHRKPKDAGHDQCGNTCAEKAKVACLLCKCRPRNGAKYHLCGKTCKRIAMKSTPMILEAPKGHDTYEMVEKKFQNAWHNVTGPLPTIKKVFKIIEDDEFLKPYAIYKQRVGNEHFRYHGTGRQCQLGVSTTQLCTSATCPICNILKTSFKISLAKTSGAFGAGVYSSSASNKAYSYTGGSNGAMLLTKVVLGKIRTVQNWNEVMSCPSGYNSVVFDRMNGQLNETIIYSDDAIRPVFLIMF